MAAFRPRRRHAAPKRTVVSPWDVEAREYLGTPESEAAVNAGLAYLAAHQQADGHWSSGGYPSDAGITGTCLLAFLAAGHQPNRGRYGLTMSEAVDWLAKSVQRGGQYAPGLIYAGQGSGQPMYGHGFATLALCEVYGMTHRRGLETQGRSRDPADRRHADTRYRPDRAYGGWRYQPMQGDADISVTVVQVLALRAARNAGLNVSQATIDRAINYMRRCSNYQSDGGFNYQVRQTAFRPGTYRRGRPLADDGRAADSPECQGGMRYLDNNRLDGNKTGPTASTTTTRSTTSRRRCTRWAATTGSSGIPGPR